MLNKKLIITLLLFSVGCFNNKKDTLTKKEKMKPAARALSQVRGNLKKSIEMADYTAFEEIIKKYPTIVKNFLKDEAPKLLVFDIGNFGTEHYKTSKRENACKILRRTLELLKESELLNKSNLIPVFSFLTRRGVERGVFNEEFCVYALRLIDEYISPEVYQEIVRDLVFEARTGEIIKSPILASAFLDCNWRICTFFIEKGIGINYYHPDIGSILFYALIFGKIDIIKLLLQKGAELLIPSKYAVFIARLISPVRILSASDELKLEIEKMHLGHDQEVPKDKKELMKSAKAFTSYLEGETLAKHEADSLEMTASSMNMDSTSLIKFSSNIFCVAFLEPILNGDRLAIKLLETAFLNEDKKVEDLILKTISRSESDLIFLLARDPRLNYKLYIMKNDLRLKQVAREGLTKVNKAGQDAIRIACDSRNVYFLPAILKTGIIDREWISRYRNEERMNLLSYIASKCISDDMAEVCEEWANAILNEEVDINQLDDNGFSALHCACCFGSLNMARLLINRRADTEVKDQYGKTAIHIAAIKGHSEMVKLLIASGARLTEKRMMVDGKEVTIYKELEIAEQKLNKLMDKSGAGVIDEKVREYQKIILALQNVLLSVD